MRFMYIMHSDAEAHGPPTPELAEAMHALARREIEAGRMIADGGLMPPPLCAEVRLRSGRLVVTDGPFTESKEVIGGFAIFELPDMAAAIQTAELFLDLHRRYAPGWEGRCEVRQLAGSQVEMIKGGG